MNREVIESSGAPRVVIDRARGDLKVIGWDRHEVAAESEAPVVLEPGTVGSSAGEADSSALGEVAVNLPGEAGLTAAGEAAESAADQDDQPSTTDGSSVGPAAEALPEGDDMITVTGKGDLKLYVPHGASLQVATVGGDFSVRGVHGPLAVSEIGGDAAFSDVGIVSTATIGGDFAISNAAGDVAISRIGGDAAVRHAEGNLSLESVAGDLAISETNGDASARAGGDAALKLTARPGRNYAFSAGGDLACNLGPESDVTIAAHSGSGRMALAVGRANVERHGPMATVVVGAGLASMSLDAGSQLALRASSGARSGEDHDEAEPRHGRARFDFHLDGDLGDLEGVIADKFESAATALDQTLAGLGLSDDDRERVVERVRSAGERAGERAQARVAKAMRKMERQMERMRERSERREAHFAGRGLRWSFNVPHPPHAPHAPHPPRPPRAPWSTEGRPGPKSVLGVWKMHEGQSSSPVPPVSDEERMTVLKMVQEGKITPAQAGELLAAMEGRGGER